MLYSPDLTRYPDHEDVESLLRSAAYFPADPVANASAQATALAVAKQARAQYQSSIGAIAARDEWEHETGWEPFLYDQRGDTTRTFYIERGQFAQTGVLHLGGGLLSVTGVSVGGHPIGAGDYIPYPLNAVQRGRAPSWLRFPLAGRWYGYAPSLRIDVTGKWGYCATLPGDVWELLQQRGALSALRSIENLQNAASFSADGFSKAYDVVGVITQTETVKEWGRDFNTMVEKYKWRAL